MTLKVTYKRDTDTRVPLYSLSDKEYFVKYRQGGALLQKRGVTYLCSGKVIACENVETGVSVTHEEDTLVHRVIVTMDVDIL